MTAGLPDSTASRPRWLRMPPPVATTAATLRRHGASIGSRPAATSTAPWRLAGVAPLRAEAGEARRTTRRRADALGNPFALEAPERRRRPRHAEHPAQFDGKRRLVHRQRFRRGAQHVVPPEQRHHRFRRQAGALLPVVPLVLPPLPPEVVAGGAGEARHAHGVAQRIQRDPRLAQRHDGMLDGEAVEAAARTEADVPLDEGHHLRQVRRGGNRARRRTR